MAMGGAKRARPAASGARRRLDRICVNPRACRGQLGGAKCNVSSAHFVRAGSHCH